MYIRKVEKEAFILVETMILTAVCILVLSMYVKSIIWDIEKSSLYSMNEDLLYMDEAELKFIDDVEEEINKNQELKDKIKDNELIKELDKIFAQYNNVVFYPAFLTGEQEIRDEDERIEFVKTMLLSMKNIKKLTTAMKFYSLPRMHACMNGDPESFTIDVNGNIYTCEYYVGKNQHRIGELNKGLFINDLSWQKILTLRFALSHSFLLVQAFLLLLLIMILCKCSFHCI